MKVKANISVLVNAKKGLTVTNKTTGCSFNVSEDGKEFASVKNCTENAKDNQYAGNLIRAIKGTMESMPKKLNGAMRLQRVSVYLQELNGSTSFRQLSNAFRKYMIESGFLDAKSYFYEGLKKEVVAPAPVAKAKTKASKAKAEVEAATPVKKKRTRKVLEAVEA